jgi:hypothetical protein
MLALSFCPQSSKTEHVNKYTFKTHYPGIANIYLSQDMISVSELYGQRQYVLHVELEFVYWLPVDCVYQGFTVTSINIYIQEQQMSSPVLPLKWILGRILFMWQRKLFTSCSQKKKISE